MEPCKYCKPNKEFEGFRLLNKDTAEYSGLTISLLHKGVNDGAILRVRSLTDDRLLVESQDAISINFCPFCGRPLARGKAKVQI